jgi:hypothetical protein
VPKARQQDEQSVVRFVSGMYGVETLEPCPFCGSDPRIIQHEERFVVACPLCLAWGPLARAVTGAMLSWNHRVRPLDSVSG